MELAQGLPQSIEKHFFGTIEISWLKKLLHDNLIISNVETKYTSEDLVILDSYEVDFCFKVQSRFPDSRIIQVADRYTFLLPNTKIIFMDLPFPYEMESISSRVLAHGIEYLPIRSFRKHKPQFKPQAERVLVTTGGSTIQDMTFMLAEEFSKVEYREINFNFIGLLDKSLEYSSNLRFHELGSGFDVIARECDTAISTAGTTMWDLLANQILVGLGAIVENQYANFDYALQSNQALGLFAPATMNFFPGAIRALLFNEKVRSMLYEEISNRYDFMGAQRTADVILGSI